MHYYQFNIGDYRKDTNHLTPIEHYIYRTLIDWYYLDEQPIPNNNHSVLRRLSLGFEHEQNLQNVLSDFFKLDENGWHHGRVESEIAEYHERLETNKNNGKLGGRPRKNPSVMNGLAKHNPKLTEVKPNQEPRTNNQEPINNKKLTPIAMLMAMGLSENTASQWLQVRKLKKQAPTQIAFERIKSHAEKNGYDFEQAILIAIENSWAGFNVEWVKTETNTPKEDFMKGMI